MCEHERGLDGRTVVYGMHRQSGELQLGRWHGLRGARVQARLGRGKGWEDGQADGPNRAKIALRAILARIIDHAGRCVN